MFHGNRRGFGRFSRPAFTLGAASLALTLGAAALLVSTDSLAAGGSGKVPRGCVSKCDRRLADARAFCERTAPWVTDGDRVAVDGELSACQVRAAEAYALCLEACGVPGDPY